MAWRSASAPLTEKADSAQIKGAAVIANPGSYQMPALSRIGMIREGRTAMTELPVIGDLDLAALELEGFSEAG